MGTAIQRLRAEAENRTRDEIYASDDANSQPSVWSMDDICDVLLNVLCCVMASDGRASRSERNCINDLMKKVQAPWDDDDVERRIDDFVRRVQDCGYRNVLQETLASIDVFKRIGREKVLIRCIDEVARAAQAVEGREQALCQQIKQMLT
jgi:hypothetical protein